jgi:hypothetical protein
LGRCGLGTQRRCAAPCARSGRATTRVTLAWRPRLVPCSQIVMCKHRMGMICAAQGDHRSAAQLLGMSKKHFGAGGEGGGMAAMLAKEADVGLSMAKYDRGRAGLPSSRMRGGWVC